VWTGTWGAYDAWLTVIVMAMRALVVVNPAATSTSPRRLDVVLGALAHELHTEVVMTSHRGHAMELGAMARAHGHDVVVSIGGDGTLNEVVNGLLAKDPGPDVPSLGVIPGGSANVFARDVGIPEDPVDATGVLLAALRSGSRRTLGLGKADGRWFTFCAGLGLDAGVIREVEYRRRAGAAASVGLYVRSALREFYRVTDRRKPAITLKLPGREPIRDLFLAVVSNVAPWTYLGRRPVNPSPRASFDAGLDVFAMTKLRTLSTVRHAAELLLRRDGPDGRDVLSIHDVPSLVLRAKPPLPYQLDGDYLGERSAVRMEAVSKALRVVA
jgi:diacylglycerol kinase family enzyme